ncbi:MAG: ECF transporter S component [Lachnospiraceae bacterium]|nr:ECF transporter S component [Lachnospiraceae bacterium]
MKKIIVKKWTTREITYIGIMAAAVYAASAFLQIHIPTVIGSTRLHMGNVMCLLAGMLLGSVQGGLAAGIGSMLFDLTNPAYAVSAPFTFCFKFAMAWICGAVIWGNKSTRISRMLRHRKVGIPIRQRYLLGSVAGSFTYVICYLSKNFMEHYFVLGLPLQAVLLMIAQKAAVSGINAVVACVVAVPLGLALRRVTAFRSQS